MKIVPLYQRPLIRTLSAVIVACFFFTNIAADYAHAIELNVPKFSQLNEFMPPTYLKSLGTKEYNTLERNVRDYYETTQRTFNSRRKEIVIELEDRSNELLADMEEKLITIKENAEEQRVSAKTVHEDSVRRYTAAYEQKRQEVEGRYDNKINQMKGMISEYEDLVSRARSTFDMQDLYGAKIGDSVLSAGAEGIVGLILNPIEDITVAIGGNDARDQFSEMFWLKDQAEESKDRLRDDELIKRQQLVAHLEERLNYMREIQDELEAAKEEAQ